MWNPFAIFILLINILWFHSFLNKLLFSRTTYTTSIMILLEDAIFPIVVSAKEWILLATQM